MKLSKMWHVLYQLEDNSCTDYFLLKDLGVRGYGMENYDVKVWPKNALQ